MIARAAGQPTICLLSLSAIADDPRVRRQGELFAASGWRVIGVGLPGERSEPPDWPILTGAGDSGRRGWKTPLPLRGAARRAALAACTLRLRFAGADDLRARLAENIYWRHLAISPIVNAVHRAARSVAADVWLANDWTALPLAARLARENGGVYAYDSHELAAEEHAEQAAWRYWKQPIVSAIERRYIGDAAVVSTVSAGIAERLDRLYALPRPTRVVRNTPHYRESGFRRTGGRIRVLYHGIVASGRGLEVAIDSVAIWRPEFHFTIRGPENPGLSHALRTRIRDLGLADRVELAPAVPMTELVRAASAFDIGFFVFPDDCWHNRFVLPNKFFEYVMAGLALCVSDLPEMARLVNAYELGVLVPRVDPGAIAAAVNSLDRERIDRCKQNALAAARELCWEREAAELIGAYACLAGHAGIR
ncbi:MAG TPA: glycosyltransferase [Stellaceae bacterium]